MHKPDENPFFPEEIVPYVDSVQTVNYFSVGWEREALTFREIYPSIHNNCGNGTCEITSDDSCLCSLVLNETHVFDSTPSQDEVLSTLKIGAFDPDLFTEADATENAYTLLESSEGVEVWIQSDSAIGSMETIFKTSNEFGEVTYFKNMQSVISLGSMNITYELRNMPSFIDLVKVEQRDAEVSQVGLQVCLQKYLISLSVCALV